MAPFIRQFASLAALLLLGQQASATWYDYAFAETSGKKDAEGNLLLKPNGTPLPDLPTGLNRATTTLDGEGNLYAAHFLEKE